MKLLYDLTVNVYLDRYEEEISQKLDSYLWHSLAAYEVVRVKDLLNKEIKDETN